MKFKFIKSLALLTTCFTPVVLVTSCNNKPAGGGEESDEWAQYIFDRTFSILGTAATSEGTRLCWGTAWVLSDSTPTITNDYKYNIATNWHVMKGIEVVHASGSNGKFWFGCNTKSSGLNIYNNFADYVEFKSFEKMGDSLFTYDNSKTITTTEYNKYGWPETKTGLRGCDIHVANVDFSSFKTSSSPSASIAKNKLDKLNELTKANKKITELADTASDSKHFENLQLYTAGYPVKNDYYATWEKHSLTAENIALQYNTGARLSTSDTTHWSDDSDEPLTDCSPQYISKTGVATSWMSGGASGSMLVGNFGTTTEPIWKICGIYWGGSGNSYNFYPYFSIFNSDWKNYLANWM